VSEGCYATYGTNTSSAVRSTPTESPTRPPCQAHHHIAYGTERGKGGAKVKVVRMFAVIQKDEHEGERRKVINRSRKSCKIMRRVAKEYPARLIHIAKGCSSHATMHLLPLLRLGLSRTGGFNTARMASSNTVLSPFCVRAEHSKYLTAPISFAIPTPCEY